MTTPTSPVEHKLLTLQHLGFNAAELARLPHILQGVGAQLGLELVLGGGMGEIVLMEGGFGDRVAPQVLHAFLEDREVVTLSTGAETSGDALGTEQQLQRQQRQLLEQLRGLLQRRPLGAMLAAVQPADLAQAEASSGFDSKFDSRMDAEALFAPEVDRDRYQLVTLMRKGMRDPSSAPLLMSYGDAATMRVDFSTQRVRLDALALQHLRLARELPYIAPRRELAADVQERDLDLVMWDLGLASRDYRLLNAPLDWWHSRLASPTNANVAHFTRAPQELDMARMLQAAPTSPADLRRKARVSLADLRGFLQACLFLGQAYWVRASDEECRVQDRLQERLQERMQDHGQGAVRASSAQAAHASE